MVLDLGWESYPEIGNCGLLNLVVISFFIGTGCLFSSKLMDFGNLVVASLVVGPPSSCSSRFSSRHVLGFDYVFTTSLSPFHKSFSTIVPHLP